MFQHVCAIPRELCCACWVTSQFGSMVDKILCSTWICVYCVAVWCISTCLAMLLSTYNGLISVQWAEHRVCTSQHSQTGWYALGCHTINTYPHTTQNFINHRPKLTCNSAGTGQFPGDGTQVPKHVGATELNNKLIQINAFLGYF
jgi:hypothetical protein